MKARSNFEDSNRLYGGNRDNGGLAIVSYDWRVIRNSSVAARPLVVSQRRSAFKRFF